MLAQERCCGGVSRGPDETAQNSVAVGFATLNELA